MDVYRRQLAAQLANTLVARIPEVTATLPELAVSMAAEVTERLRAIEAEEAEEREAASTRCRDTHPLDGARCIQDKGTEHGDLHRDGQGRAW